MNHVWWQVVYSSRWEWSTNVNANIGCECEWETNAEETQNQTIKMLWKWYSEFHYN